MLLFKIFFKLVELTKDKTIYGCSLVTDSDFGSVFLKLNTITKKTKKLDSCDYWDVYNWKFSNDDLAEKIIIKSK